MFEPAFSTLPSANITMINDLLNSIELLPLFERDIVDFSFYRDSEPLLFDIGEAQGINMFIAPHTV